MPREQFDEADYENPEDEDLDEDFDDDEEDLDFDGNVVDGDGFES